MSDLMQLSLEPKSLTANSYLDELLASGTRAVAGSDNTIWISYESFALARYPTYCLAEIEEYEIKRVFRQGKKPILSFSIEPDNRYPANSILYLVQRNSYNLEYLSKNARRDIRIAQRSLKYDFVPQELFINKGYPAFRDTRTRVGLNDGTEENFLHRCKLMERKGNYIAGAWKDDQLVAYTTLILIDDAVEIEGSFSMDQFLNLCPNDGLMHFVLDYFFTIQRYNLVSYGLSSIQLGHENAGLDKYKKKVGFHALPIHRRFEFHPLFQPFISPYTLVILKLALVLSPKSRILCKAAGVLSASIQGH